MLDNSFHTAFLSLAFQEELLLAKDHPRSVERFFAHRVPTWQKRMLFYNIVLHGMLLVEDVYNTPVYETKIDGPLRDTGLIQFYKHEPPTEVHEEKAAFPSFDLFESYFAARHYKLPRDTLRQMFNEHEELKQDVLSRFPQIPMWIMQDGAILYSIGDFVLYHLEKRQRAKPSSRVSTEDIEAFRKFKATNEALQLVERTFSELMSVVQLSGAHKADMLLQLAPAEKTELRQLNKNILYETMEAHEFYPQNCDKYILFQIVSDELGQVPYRTTLKETLELAKKPECVALRQFVAEWAEGVRGGAEGELKRLQAEIRRAKRHLQEAQAFSMASNVVTYIGVPMSIASMLVPILGGIGLTVSLVGAYVAGRAQFANGLYKWAMFGRRG